MSAIRKFRTRSLTTASGLKPRFRYVRFFGSSCHPANVRFRDITVNKLLMDQREGELPTDRKTRSQCPRNIDLVAQPFSRTGQPVTARALRLPAWEYL